MRSDLGKTKPKLEVKQSLNLAGNESIAQHKNSEESYIASQQYIDGVIEIYSRYVDRVIAKLEVYFEEQLLTEILYRKKRWHEEEEETTKLREDLAHVQGGPLRII